jgi:hypothetical protein
MVEVAALEVVEIVVDVGHAEKMEEVVAEREAVEILVDVWHA